MWFFSCLRQHLTNLLVMCLVATAWCIKTQIILLCSNFLSKHLMKVSLHLLWCTDLKDLEKKNFHFMERYRMKSFLWPHIKDLARASKQYNRAVWSRLRYFRWFSIETCRTFNLLKACTSLSTVMVCYSSFMNWTLEFHSKDKH